MENIVESRSASSLSEVNINSRGLWRKAIRFYLSRGLEIAWVFPLFFVPVLTDRLLSGLIMQDRSNRGTLDLGREITGAARDFFPLFLLKLRFAVIASVWTLIPIVGWYKDLGYIVDMSMASNVMVFENLRGKDAIRRIITLRESTDFKRAVRTLVIIPGTLAILCYIVLILGIMVTDSNIFFWIPMAAMLAISFPLTAAVKTYHYLSSRYIAPAVQPDEPEVEAGEDSDPLCEGCIHFQKSTGACKELLFNVVEYPDKYLKKCGGKYFKNIEQRLGSG